MSQVPIKETSSSEVSRIGYWPGRVVAESLGVTADESGENSAGQQRTVRIESVEQAGDDANGKRPVSITLKAGSAFSAIINSMLPIDLLTSAARPADEYVYDEFGFRIERDEEETKSSATNGNGGGNESVTSGDFVNIRLSPVPHKLKKASISQLANGTFSNAALQPFVEDSKHKLKWIAYLGNLYREFPTFWSCLSNNK